MGARTVMRDPEAPEGWTPVADTQVLVGRWTYPPVAGQGRYQRIGRAVGGRCEGRDFYAFATPTRGVRYGNQTVVAVDAGRPLPRLTVTQRIGLHALLRAVVRRRVVDRDAPPIVNLVGVETGDDEFDCRFHIRADDAEAARHIVHPGVCARLLAAPELSLACQGTDVLCWQTARSERGPIPLEDLDALLALAIEVVAP